ncbi:MAG: polyphosphate kinase 1 [Ilumatobacteraceae bacterium]
MTSWRNFFRRRFATNPVTYASGIDARIINRELSWLDFNARVLAMASDTGVPLLERCRFVSIFSSNLDEFFQIRVAALKGQVEGDVRTVTPDGRDPLQQLNEIRGIARQLVQHQERVWLDELVPELARHAIRTASWREIDDAGRTYLRDIFESRVFPVLTPLAVDPAHPFPYISNLALSLAIVVRDPKSGEERFARVKLPQTFPRFFQLPDSLTFVSIEEVVSANLSRLFPGMEIVQCHAFRVTRNADLSVDDEDAEDLLVAIEMELRRRRFGKAVRLEVPKAMSVDLVALLVEELELEPEDVVRRQAFIDLTALNQLANLNFAALRHEPWPPLTAGRLLAVEDGERSIFSVIRERQLLVHHPHESFSSSVETFVQQAATDPQVQSIKMTLYRTTGDSAIARHLIHAAELGKQVAVVLELKARFDEARNVTWAKELEYAGVHVTYGIVGLKTHSKCVLVVRNDPDKMRRYVHIGTGNYNSSTARLYEDIGFFTCEDEIGSDVAELFNFLTGYAQEPNYKVLLVAPRQLRNRIIALIDKEATFGDAGRITIKINSISDPAVIEALYRASGAGVKIQFIVRGICCIRAGVLGMSENIEVRSILGRYLEHSRIYRFEHGLDNDEPLHLIGSADMMGRNLDGRVEALAPLTHPKHRMWLDKVLGFLLDDTSTHFLLNSDNHWTRVGSVADSGDAQKKLHEWVVATQVR